MGLNKTSNCKFLLSFAFACHLVLPAEAASLRENIPFKDKGTDVAEGQISVPIDWENPSERDTLTLSYQILGASHYERPILIFIGGGPAASSIDQYFLEPTERDGLEGYPKHFRVVLFDQRGVGRSSPIESTTRELTAEIAFQYFAARAHAQDVGALVRTLVPPNAPFFLMAHSYGGAVVERYMTDNNLPKPDGVFLVSILPFGPRTNLILERVRQQISQNRSLIPPEMRDKILLIKKYIKDHDVKVVDSNGVTHRANLNVLYTNLAIGQIRSLKFILEELAKNLDDRTVFQRTLASLTEKLNGTSLGCALSVCDIINPLTEGDLIPLIDKHFEGEIEDWMLLEVNFWRDQYDMVVSPFQDEELRNALKNYQPMNFQKLAEAFKNIPLISLAGDNDGYVPLTAARAGFDLVNSGKPIHHFEVLEGGSHSSGLGSDVAEFVANHHSCTALLNKAAE